MLHCFGYVHSCNITPVIFLQVSFSASSHLYRHHRLQTLVSLVTSEDSVAVMHAAEAMFELAAIPEGRVRHSIIIHLFYLFSVVVVVVVVMSAFILIRVGVKSSRQLRMV